MSEQELFELKDVNMNEENKTGKFLFTNTNNAKKSSLNIEADEKEKVETRGRKRKPETDLLVRQTYLVTDEIKRALKIKAITEGLQLNDLIRKIFTEAIEPQYFENLKE